jgi:AraC-like DNA-binding protein
MRTTVGTSEASTAGDYLVALRDFAMAKGINAQTLLKGSNLSFDELLNPPPRVNSLAMNQVAANLYQALDDPYEAAVEFGLSMAISSHGPLGIAAQGAHNLMAAFEMVAQYYSTRTSSQTVELITEDRWLRMRLINQEIPELNAATRYFFDIATLLSIVNCGQQILESLNQLPGEAKINIDRPQPEDFDHTRLPAIVDFVFDQPTLELCLPLAWMTQPLQPRNPELALAAADRCESELRAMKPLDLVTEIRQRIRSAGEQIPTLETLAQQLYMSPSTLKRRLKEQHTTYQELKAEERLERAKQLLQEGHSAEVVSMQLGFSDASNFTKAFKNWTGITPREFRQQLQNP